MHISKYLTCPECKDRIHFNDVSAFCATCNVDFHSKTVLKNCRFTSFAVLETHEISRNSKIYDASILNSRYRNFLNWLFATFVTTEKEFRMNLFRNLKIRSGEKILITGIGNGDDLLSLLELHPDLGLEIHGQDISEAMCEFSIQQLELLGLTVAQITVSNAARLPYIDQYFDHVFHFGGINWMGEKQKAIEEMVRVCRDGGKIMIIDESVAPWLRNSEYGQMMINNNQLWSAQVPVDILPFNINNLNLQYTLENCFYVLSFERQDSFPTVNLEVEHLGLRGGSINSRWYGKMDGVSPELLDLIKASAANSGVSVFTWMNSAIKKALS